MRGHTKQDLSALNYTMISLLSNKVNILIVGGGEAAFIKCRSFSKEGCNVTVVSKEFCEEFKQVKDLSNVELIKDGYNEGYVDHNHIVIIATNDSETNDIIKKYCDNKSKLYVHCEDHKKGLLVMPVQGNTSNMKFALHTKHSSPKTALFMAQIIENKLLKYKDFIDYTFTIRDKVMKMADKKDIMNFVCSEDFYFFYDLGLQDYILEMFYGDGLKEVLGMEINIGTRKSELAQVQANTIMAMIKEKFDLECVKVLIETKGDKILNVTLDKIGGKGLFVKEIEYAMLEKKVDMAVHSMKDVPYDVPKEFEIAAIPVREDVRDAFVAFNNISFCDLPKGARIGTSSIRRGVQLKMIRSDIEIVPIRGNVQTRIAKIEKENLDGIILAAAGLKRLNMESIITNYFDVTQMVPAIAQGALGIEMLKTHPQIDMIKKLDCYDARICVEAERSFMATLNGDCHGCIGAYAYLENDNMHMLSIFDVNGKIVKKQLSGHKNDYIKLGVMLAKMILEDN